MFLISLGKVRKGNKFNLEDRWFASDYFAEIKDIVRLDSGKKRVVYELYSPIFKDTLKTEHYCSPEYFASKYIMQDYKFAEKIIKKGGEK